MTLRNPSVVLFVIAFCVLGSTPHAAGADVVELSFDTFSSSVRQGVWLVEFFAPWCPHCKALAPIWDELATKAEGFKVAKVDCVSEPAVCEDQSVSGFPTIFLYSGKESTKATVESRRMKFTGQRDVESFIQFVKENAKPTSASETQSEEPPSSSSSQQEVDPSGGAAITLTADTWAETEKGAWFVEFYAPWCGFCKKLAPLYSDFAALENPKGEFKVAKVNCDESKSICSKYGVNSFPTLKFVMNGEVFDHVGSQTIADMSSFARGIIEDASKDDSSAVIELTSNNFERKVMAKDGAWMIDFYAPWCGHCKELAPTWEEFATQAKANGDEINVAKVDCDANEALCERFGLAGYPTIKLLQIKSYPTGKDRSVRGFQTFWEKHEGIFVNPAASDVVILNHENFRSKTRVGTWLIDFYAPWCGHCKNLAPVLEEMATKQKGNFFVAKYDCEGEDNKNFALCDEFGIEGYPTIMLWNNGRHVGVYKEERSLDKITDWVEAFEEDIPEDEEEITDVISLHDDTFKRRTGTGNWLVEFYAPWCGHCKQLAPIWEEVALVENPAGRVKVAKIDCTRYTAICAKQDVTSYPTIAFLKNGKEKKPRFSGERSLEAIRRYVDKFVPREEGKFEDNKDIIH